ncbi:unnamed protein product [Toxocara canis]|uniref:WH1 domain-containing protein n=1 Tax=Toxocara canis TaxID=6265 RepID=A0A183URZ8_TOXCA|nr:unnamed protein product [Toxocara canis]
MSNMEERNGAPEQSTSGSANSSHDDQEEREDLLLAESVGQNVAIGKRRSSLNARYNSRRPQLHSENSFGAMSSHKQRTNHLTVECLVSVRAQVLTWDDALGGWLPLDDGALCGVSLLQQASVFNSIFSLLFQISYSQVTCQQSLSPSSVQPTKRSSWSGVLSQVLLNCTLMPHVTYRNAMPTFHHWRVKDQRFGLSFGSAFDASKFHNRLQKALDHLCRQSKSSSGESNIDASEELEDDVFAPTELPDSFSSSSTARPISFNNMANDTEASVEQRARKDHQSQSLPPISIQYPVPIIRTTLSCSPVGARDSVTYDEYPPMDPEMARPCVSCSFAASTTETFYANVLPTGQQSKGVEKTSAGEGARQTTAEKKEDEKSEEDDLMITDDAISLPTTLHQSFAVSLSSSSKTDKTDSKVSDRHSMSRLHSKSRSEISSLGYRMPIMNEKMRSVSNPGTDFFFTQNRYPQLERYVTSPAAVIGTRSFIEAHASLYKNREHIVLPRKKQSSSEMIRRECCIYCRNWYNVGNNPRGACKEAPDPIEIAIRRLTCYSVAQAVVYHCCREGDEMPVNIGRYGQGYNVCSCGPSGASRTKRMKRWLLLALISLLVPCLCCYLPARCTYDCCCKGRRGRHKPCTNPDENDQLLARRRTSRRLSRLSF